MGAVRTFLSQPPPRRRLLVSTTLLLLVAEAMLTAPLFTVHSVQRAIQFLTRVLYPRGGVVGEPDDVAWSVDAVAPFLPESVTCLRRALVAQSLLERDGRPADMRIGVMKTGTELKAHAWVEHDGRVLVGQVHDLAQYVPLTIEEIGL
jgi:hypothetical protein